MKKFIKYTAILAISFCAFALLVLYGPIEIGTWIFESGEQQRISFAKIKARKNIRGKCHGQDNNFKKCWETAYKTEVSRLLSDD